MSAYSPYSIDIPFSHLKAGSHGNSQGFSQIVHNGSFWKEFGTRIGLYKHAAIRISLFNYVEK